jgi:hypothetical protein
MSYDKIFVPDHHIYHKIFSILIGRSMTLNYDIYKVFRRVIVYDRRTELATSSSTTTEAVH